MTELIVGLTVAYVVASFTWAMRIERRLTRIEQKMTDLCRWLLSFIYKIEEEVSHEDT